MVANLQALIIDDNQLNGEIIVTLLQEPGVEAAYASLPRQIPEMLANLPNLCVIFLDLELPNHSGFEIHRQLRVDRNLNGIPIVAYTVHTSEMEQVRQAGFDGFLGKPIIPEHFPSQLERILSGESVWEI